MIGAICGTSWDTDFEMAIQNDGTTYKLEGVELKANEEFKVRQGHNWDNNYGAGGVEAATMLRLRLTEHTRSYLT